MAFDLAFEPFVEKDAYFEEILKHVRPHLKDAHQKPFETYLKSYYAKLSYERLIKLDPQEHAKNLLNSWNFFKEKPPHQPKTQVYYWHAENQNAFVSDRIVIEMVNEDRPFLVGSLLGLLSRLGLQPRQIIHPIFTVKRDAAGCFLSFEPRGTVGDSIYVESFIHCEIVEAASQEMMEKIQQNLPTVLNDVLLATQDWKSLYEKVQLIRQNLSIPVQFQTVDLKTRVAEIECIRINEDSKIPQVSKTHSLKEDEYKNHPRITVDDRQELDQFLTWLREDHFTFLGYAYFDLYDADDKLLREPQARDALGILRIPERCHLDFIFEGLEYRPSTRRLLFDPQPLLMNKTTVVSNVHRPVAMDAVGIKCFNDQGHAVGVHLFLGLFTSIAYDSSARDIPYLRRKIDQILAKTELSPEWYDGKALVHILDSLPRDELFQASVEELAQISLAILFLTEHPRVALFLRQDIFNRYVSCLVYIPRDCFDSEVVTSIGNVLAQDLGGDISLTKVHFGSLDFARVHYIITLPKKAVKAYDLQDLELKLINLARSWKDDLRLNLQEHLTERHSARLYRLYRNGFSKAYQERYHGQSVLDDILKCEEVYETGLYTAHLSASPWAPDVLCFRLYHPEKPMALSDILPQLENLGFRVISEIPFKIKADGVPYPIWMHEFELHPENHDRDTILEWRDALIETIFKIRDKAIEDDAFNKLVLSAKLTWRQVEVIRAYGKYLRQLEIPFGQRTIQMALLNYPQITKAIIELFESKLDVLNPLDDLNKVKTIQQLLDQVQSPDDDRILRRYLNLVHATIRTNYFQRTSEGLIKPCLALKFDGRLLQDIPLPKPLYEIFVYSTKVEAVHLRGGKVARGGIRWSDRFEDFRTEILGLMKAQMVKNAVIVPVGSKGGFVIKTLTPTMTREEILKEGIAGYETMIQGMLDITDNLIHGKIIPPLDTARWDEDDPYLVVAADKGTATFSDYSNALSQKNQFWLDDAFASGGSVGYDHKKMGITAKGAWESVKRHFREISLDPEVDPITVVGIGDMSGDVFGNGMLQSRSLKLIAAFNHLHIFLDPTPDPSLSYQERQRLFDLPRSTWKDYNPDLISKGGGVFEKTAKVLSLSPEMQNLLNCQENALSPDDLIKRLLKMPVDLLWFGGIGTFIKGTYQSNNDVGDRNNDSVRINGKDVQARVIAEGANLAMTHLGRIEYARKSQGHLNTDAIDNSAGVDCSDHEVNIKILLSSVMIQGNLTREERNQLLVEMTDEISSLVLQDNYLQNFCISMMQALGPGALDGHIRLIRDLEKRGHLNRNLEFLPEDVALLEMQSAQIGLSRPELSVVLAYAKLFVYQELLKSDLPEDPYLNQELLGYFPKTLQEKYGHQIEEHPLRREIIATSLANQVVNRMGASFVHDLLEKTGYPVDQIVKSYIVATKVLQLPKLWQELESYDRSMRAPAQMLIFLDILRLLRRASHWLIRQIPLEGPLEPVIDRLYEGIHIYLRDIEVCLNPEAKEKYQGLIDHYEQLGANQGCALRLATLRMAAESPDILLIGEKTNTPIFEVARLYFIVTSRFQFSSIRFYLEELHAPNAWTRQVISGIMEDIYSIQSQAVLSVLKYVRQERLILKNAEENVFERWKSSHETLMNRYDHLMADAKATGFKDVAVFIPLVREMRLLFEKLSKE